MQHSSITLEAYFRKVWKLLLPRLHHSDDIHVIISLSHSKHVLPSWTVAHVVNALVVSSIRYCVAIYGSCNITQLNRIQKLLNFCARVISGRRKFQHISDVLQQLRWLPAVQLVKYHRLCLVKTALETSLPSDIAAMFSHVSTPYQTRQTGLLQNHRARTCSGTRMLAHCSSVFNQLPPDLRCLSGNAFKRNLKKLLLIEAWPDDWDVGLLCFYVCWSTVLARVILHLIILVSSPCVLCSSHCSLWLGYVKAIV